MYPAYGLAEATLAVTAPTPLQDLHVLRVDKAALACGRIEAASELATSTEIVGCGHAVPGVEVAIVDASTGSRCPADLVGEIWISGPGRSEGYSGAAHGDRLATTARLAGSDVDWLRTGDLGFVTDGDLFITGRLKDVIILRGANIYPQDLEQTAASSHDALRDECACAFSLDGEVEEGIVLVCEIDRRREAEAALAATAIRRAIWSDHGLETHVVAIVRLGSVPKTPSGKVQRRACRDAFLSKTLAILMEDRLYRSAAFGDTPPRDEEAGHGALDWVLRRLRKETGQRRLGPHTALADLGLTSLQITQLAAEIEVRFGRRISTGELYELRKVGDIVDRLASPL
jgi:acyl-CoA synthetase (AMP-forming)/AMP-acid ligase II/acyl carrier protein